MSNQKVLQVAIKLANKYNEAFSEQRAKLETFYYDTSKFFRALINEMDGDLLTLKQKKVHEDVIKAFAKIAHKLTELYVDIDPERPYTGMETLINWADSKETKVTIDNLHFLIKEYLKRNKDNFEQTPSVKHAGIDSLRKLQVIVPKLRAFMLNNPLLPDPRPVSTLPPPMRVDVPRHLTNDDPTVIYPVENLQNKPAAE